MSRAPEHPVVVIPARLASQRLPGKPLADIEGTPMVIHVLRRAEAAAVGPVVVAAAEAEIAEAVSAAGGRAVATRPDHASGSDRVYEALQSVDPEGAFDAAINLQGDLPAIEPAAIRAVLAAFAHIACVRDAIGISVEGVVAIWAGVASVRHSVGVSVEPIIEPAT